VVKCAKYLDSQALARFSNFGWATGPPPVHPEYTSRSRSRLECDLLRFDEMGWNLEIEIKIADPSQVLAAIVELV
jgi:hypothetical protein